MQGIGSNIQGMSKISILFVNLTRFYDQGLALN